MFDTFIIKDILRLVSRLFLFVTGWKVSGTLPTEKSFVMIAAPHTSNWDLPYMLTVSFALKANPYWMGKAQIFKFPFKSLMKWMGGIVTVPPEGTRSKVKYWKTGFYHIAHLANAPIVLGFLDYEKKVGGVGPTIYPTGDIEKDMHEIKSFYSTISGKYPTAYEESK